MRCVASALVVLLLTAGVGYAADFVPLRGEPAVPFKFDAEDGHYMDLGLDSSCPANALRTKIHFIRLGKPTTQWRPGASIGLKSGEKSLYFHLWAKTFQPPYQADIIMYDNDKKVANVDFKATFGADDRVPVLVSWTPKGDVTVMAGEENHTVHLPGPVESVRLTGSTGAGEFDPLEVGRMDGAEACVAP